MSLDESGLGVAQYGSLFLDGIDGCFFLTLPVTFQFFSLSIIVHAVYFI